VKKAVVVAGATTRLYIVYPLFLGATVQLHAGTHLFLDSASF
jgi:hypothetical protein